MADELKIPLNPFTDTGLTLLAKVYNSSGTQEGATVTMNEDGPALYIGDYDVTTRSDGQYMVRFETNSPDKLYGTGSLYIRDGKEVSPEMYFNAALDTVANVTLVATTTTNTDMRGTDGANTVAPDNAGIAQIQTDISNLNDTTAAEVYTEFTSGNNEDAFKADVSSLATEANATANTNSIITEVNANETKLDTIDTNVDSILEDTSTTIPNQINGLNDISTADVKTQADQALIDYDPPTKAELDSAESSIIALIPSVANIADGVWDEPYSEHTTALTFGKLMDLLRKANRAIDGEVTGTPTVSSFSTNLTGYTNGAFDSELMVFVSGSINGEARPILSYSGGTFTFEEEWTQAPSANDEFVILPYHTHPISEIQEGLAKRSELQVINEGVKKSSKIIPHNTDI